MVHCYKVKMVLFPPHFLQERVQSSNVATGHCAPTFQKKQNLKICRKICSHFPFRNDVKCYMQQARFLTVRCHFRQQQSSIWGSEKQIEIANEEKFFLWHGTSKHSSSSSQISYYVHEVFIVQLLCYYPIGNSDWKRKKEVCQLQFSSLFIGLL